MYETQQFAALAHCQHLTTITRHGNVGCAKTCAVNQNVIEVTILNILSMIHAINLGSQDLH